VIKNHRSSIYEARSSKLIPQTTQFINDLLERPEFAGGDAGEAFDKLFGKSTIPNKANEIALDSLKSMVSRHMMNKSYTDDILNNFI